MRRCQRVRVAWAFKDGWGDEEGRRAAYKGDLRQARRDGVIWRGQRVRVAWAFKERWGDEEGRRVAYKGD